MTNFSRRQVLSLPMAASVVGAGAAGAAYAADSNSKVNAPDFDAIEDRMTLLTKRGASLSIRQKHLAVLSVAAGLGFEDLGERTAAAALADGLAPGDIEEAVFHASPYAGMARTRAVLAGVHTAMTAAGIALPLESRTVVSDENRLQKGIAVQTEIFVSAISIPAKVFRLPNANWLLFARLRRSEAVRHSLVLMLRQIFAAGTRRTI